MGCNSSSMELIESSVIDKKSDQEIATAVDSNTTTLSIHKIDPPPAPTTATDPATTATDPATTATDPATTAIDPATTDPAPTHSSSPPTIPSVATDTINNKDGADDDITAAKVTIAKLELKVNGLTQDKLELESRISELQAVQHRNQQEITSLMENRNLSKKKSQDVMLVDQDDVEINRVRDQYLQMVESLKSSHTEEVQSLKSSHAEEVQSLKSSHAEEVQSLKSSHTEEVQSLKSSHAEEVQSLKSSHAEEVQSLKSSTEE